MDSKQFFDFWFKIEFNWQSERFPTEVVIDIWKRHKERGGEGGRGREREDGGVCNYFQES